MRRDCSQQRPVLDAVLSSEELHDRRRPRERRIAAASFRRPLSRKRRRKASPSLSSSLWLPTSWRRRPGRDQLRRRRRLGEARGCRSDHRRADPRALGERLPAAIWARSAPTLSRLQLDTLDAMAPRFRSSANESLMPALSIPTPRSTPWPCALDGCAGWHALLPFAPISIGEDAGRRDRFGGGARGGGGRRRRNAKAVGWCIWPAAGLKLTWRRLNRQARPARRHHGRPRADRLRGDTPSLLRQHARPDRPRRRLAERAAVAVCGVRRRSDQLADPERQAAAATLAPPATGVAGDNPRGSCTSIVS